MANILTRSSALAVKVETTEGTPVAPTAATDYLALQDDFAMDPAKDILENAELKASLGASKPIQGPENPTASFSHYLRHSGVEGTAPNYKELLEAGFGTENVQATQRLTDAGSTTSVIKMAGFGSEYFRGKFFLIKDATNGYSIRPVHSMSVDDATIGFNVSVAPASGVGLGKPVTYYPANSGHQSLSIWHYLGNSGAIQMMSGSRVVETAISITAGELINVAYSLEGLKFYFDPISIASTDRYLDFTDDAGTFAAIVTAQMYRDPHEVAEALQAAMRATATTTTPTVTYSDTTGKFNIKTTGTVLSLLWNTGANAANTIGDKIGFSTAADDTGTAATTGYTSDNAQSWASPQTPSFDSADPLVAKDNEVLIGEADDLVCFKASTFNFTLGTPKTLIDAVCAVTGRVGSVISARTGVATITALLEQHDADKFQRFRNNTETRALYNFGIKSNNNWVAGKCGGLYLPNTTVTSLSLSDADGLVQMEMELTTFVDSSGNGEVYLGFV